MSHKRKITVDGKKCEWKIGRTILYVWVAGAKYEKPLTELMGLTEEEIDTGRRPRRYGYYNARGWIHVGPGMVAKYIKTLLGKPSQAVK